MQKPNLIFISILLCVSVFYSCNTNKSKKDTTTSEPTPLVLPEFNQDSAFYFVKKQTEFGARVPNTLAHKQCAEYLEATLTRFCHNVVIQPFTATTFDGSKLKSKNIIGIFNPDSEKRILLAAHWDSRPVADNDANPAHHKLPVMGANDGASGVGVLLEIARQLSISKPEVGVDIIFFDAEDWGTPNGNHETGDWWGLGAQYWAKNPHKKNYKAEYGILLDMVGARNAKFFQEGISMNYAPQIVAKVWAKAYQFGFKNYFINQPSNPITDDHYYVNKYAKIPMINIIHQDITSGTGFYYTWHTTQDVIENIDPKTLWVVGSVVLGVIKS